MNARQTQPNSPPLTARCLRASGTALLLALTVASTAHAQVPMAPMTGSAASQSASMPAMDMKKSMQSMHEQMGSRRIRNSNALFAK